MVNDIKFRVCSMGEYDYRIVLINGTDEMLIPYISFGNKDAADKYIADHYETLVREYAKPKRKTSKSTNSSSSKAPAEKTPVMGADNTPAIPIQKENDIELVLTEADGTKYYVVKSNDKYDAYYIRVSLANNGNYIGDVDFSQMYFEKNQAISYVKNNYLKLKRDALNALINNRKADRTSGTSDNNKGISKGGRIVIYAATAAVLAGTIALASCQSCKGKGTKNATNEDDAIFKTEIPKTNTSTKEPESNTQAPVLSTPDVVESSNRFSEDDINNMSQDVLDGYMKVNSSMDVINNGGLNGSKITSEDLKNVIAILNIDELSMESYDTFKEIVSNSQPDAFSNNVDFILTNLMASNMQEYAMKKYDPNSDKKLSGLLWLSPMIMDETDRHDMELIEGKIERIMQEDLNGDKDKVRELAKELRNMLNSQSMKNRGNGFDRALYYELETLITCSKDSMTKDQRNNIISVKEAKRETTYVAIMNILSNIRDYGCYLDVVDNNGMVIESTLIRTRHI